MIKRIIYGLISAVLLLGTVSVSAFAGDAKVRGAYIDLPKAYIEVDDDFKKSDIDEIKIGDDKLTVIKTHSDCSKVVYMLVDISGSMSQYRLNALKPSLINYATSLGDDDKFVLMTFGTEVTTLLEGGESDAEIEEAINGISCYSDSTTFYLAINEAYKLAMKETEYARKFAFVISDGADYETGAMSKDELVDIIEGHSFPVYGLCDSATDKVSADNFGEICRTSGGELEKFSDYSASEDFDKIKSYTEDVTIIQAKANTKKSLGEVKLVMKINGKKVSSLVNAKAKNDTTAPKLESVEFEKDSNSFILNFSEAVENFDDITVLKGKAEKEIAIVDRRYANDAWTSVKLVAEKNIYTGNYTFDLSEVTDMTDNENHLDEERITEKVKANSIIIKIAIILGIALIPVAFLVALYFILQKAKREQEVETIKDIFVKKEKAVIREQVHIVDENPQGKAVLFNIIKPSGQIATANFTVSGLLFVGRTIGDLCVDDSGLSSQHFALESVDNGFFVVDLQSTNGTFVNGVQIQSKTFVNSGDKIAAGNTVFIIEY